ncbi:MAG: hypothetical protein AAF497_04535 [Planctomycetota bacterium]
MTGFFNRLNSVILRMGTDEWAIVGIALVVIGFIFLRGFGKNARL